MCRFALYLGAEISLGSLLTEPVNSIIHQSFHSHEWEEPLNGDGFGVAWYANEIEQPALFKDITPAWNNLNLRNLARVTKSNCILAHVRAATPGLPVIQLNCHPFACGPFTFMHNGTIGGFHQIKRVILERLSDEAFSQISGSTDSEFAFALFMDHFHKMDKNLSRPERMVAALTSTIADLQTMKADAGVEEPCFLNLVVSDGRCAVVSRYTSNEPKKAHSLYLHTGRRYVCENGVCRMIEPEQGQGAVIVASEPLSEDKGWTQVRPNSLILIHQDLQVETQDLNISVTASTN